MSVQGEIALSTSLHPAKFVHELFVLPCLGMKFQVDPSIPTL